MLTSYVVVLLVATSQSPNEAEQLQRLRDLMQNAEPAVRVLGVQEVSKLAGKPEGTEYRKLLFSTLADSNEDVRLATLTSIEDLDPARIPVLTLIPRAVPDLRALLKDKNSTVRLKAANALRMFGPRAEDAVPDLVRLVDDPDPSVRARSVLALGTIRAHPDKVVPVLIRALKDPDDSVAAAKKGISCSVPHAAAVALGEYGTEAAAAVSPLMETAKSTDRALVIAAIYALGGIHSKPEIVLPFLLRLLTDASHEDMRGNVAKAIGCFRGEAKHAVPDLLKAMKCEGVKDPELVERIHTGVLLAFKTMGPAAEDAVPAVLDLFLDQKQDSGVRKNAIQTLGKIGAGSTAAVPRLIEVFPKKEFTSYTYEIGNSLASIGEPAVEPLVKLLRSTMGAKLGSNEFLVRGATIHVLGQIGPKAEMALPLLHEALEDEDDGIRREAKKALQQIEKK